MIDNFNVYLSKTILASNNQLFKGYRIKIVNFYIFKEISNISRIT